uniref:methionine adenosyltransferase n=1 Tax=Glossina morsitans morsitans TaxID=37546 RepID=A0A1B0FCE5_GLOMM
MEQYVIKGGNPLVGEVEIGGAKNAALAILSAAIMTDETILIENLPDVHYLVNTKHAEVPLPGGCNIGSRPIDQHLKGFRALGASVKILHGAIVAETENLHGSHIFLDVVSVGATINIMMAAAMASGRTIIENAAREPHVVDVANFLNSMGANIKGAGTDVIRIKGVEKLHRTEYSIIPDQIEAGTFMFAAAATGGDVTVKNVIPKHLEATTAKLEEIGCEVEEFDDAKIVRDTVREIGYTRGKYGFDADTCAVITAIDEQSADIAMGVDKALEAKMGEDEIDAIGAGDQGMMFGYASNETEEYMPYAINMAHKLARQLTKVRKDGTLPYLRPDGKTQVTVEYSEEGKPIRIDAVVCSTQHDPEVTQEQIHEDIKKYVFDAIIPADMVDDDTKYFINPTGRFVIGGPHGDSGLTGRKIIVDTYGGAGRHGGGAFS